jgi:hypothetical protein
MTARRAALLAGAGAATVSAVLLRARARRALRRAVSVIADPMPATVVDESGAVRSVQAADLTLPEPELDRIWSPMHLERLARTYWRYLTRISLGLIRVRYTPTERQIVFLARPFVLLRFHAPEYEMDAQRGIVRWRIKDGVLVAPRGRGQGYLQIDARRHPGKAPGEAILHVEVEVANFYPAIASTFSLPAYKITQSQIHVIVTHGFLRSLEHLDLVPSRVGRFAGRGARLSGPSIDEVPDPPRAPAEAAPS